MKNVNVLLNNRIQKTGSFLCVGLDPEEETFKTLNINISHLFEVTKNIVDATAKFASAFKLQFAHYAAIGQEHCLSEICSYIKSHYSDIPIILDAKRGDIGNTAKRYSQEAFERYGADAVTINPYMGTDSITPFIEGSSKAAIVLIKTSNPSATEIQDLRLENGKRLYIHIAEHLLKKYNNDQIWFVIGANNVEDINLLRKLAPETTLLIPGIGAQGGNADEVIKNGVTKRGDRLILNVSRGITKIDTNTNSMSEYLNSVYQKAEGFHSLFKKSRDQYI